MKLSQVMLYVNDQARIRDFWVTYFNFIVKKEERHGEMYVVQLAPHENAETMITLHDRALIARLSPEVNLGTPSLLFATDQFEVLYDRLLEAGVTVGDITPFPGGRVFNFSDPEDNYFAVYEA